MGMSATKKQRKNKIKKEKDNFQQDYLYIEDIYQEKSKEKEELKDEENRGIIIIDIFN